MPETFGYAIFCDDIRQEVGGKVSFMGIYSGSLHAVSKSPIVLPKLAVAMTVVIPEGISVAKPIEFVLYLEVDGTDSEMVRAEAEGLSFPLPAARPGRVTRIGLNFQFSPFPINKEGILKARAQVDGKEVKLGALALSLTPPEDTPQPAQG